jgi:hypothetical protein
MLASALFCQVKKTWRACTMFEFEAAISSLVSLLEHLL